MMLRMPTCALVAIRVASKAGIVAMTQSLDAVSMGTLAQLTPPVNMIARNK